MKNNYTKVVTGVGVSQYAWLTQPDTRFDEIGHYKTNLILYNNYNLLSSLVQNN